MFAVDLGALAYREGWKVQEQIHEAVVNGAEERILFVEHPPVITLGRRPGVIRNLVASPERLIELGVEVVQSDRGGDITFHGPGQVVAYPIIRLNDHGLSVARYVRTLEQAAIDTLADFGIAARREAGAVGVWADVGAGMETPAKICAIGVRVRRGVSLHGLALNVTTDLRFFDLIVPCGLAGRPVASLESLLGEGVPSMERVQQALAHQLLHALSISCRP